MSSNASLHTPEDRIIRNGRVGLATRDFGGAGATLLLIHGLGRNLEDWRPIIPALVGSHRVIAMDLRGHGESGDGLWTLENVIGDLRAVVEGYRLPAVAVMGHSIGGMIAAVYGTSEQGCLAAINLDGHGRGREDQYVGLDPDYVRDRWAELKGGVFKILPGEGAPLDAKQVAALRQSLLERLPSTSAQPDAALAVLDRSLQLAPDGRYCARPSRPCVDAVLRSFHKLQLFDVYRRVRCPLLIFQAVVPGRLETSWIAEFMASYREGLRRDLAALSVDCPQVSVETIEATHALVAEQPCAIASRVETFLREASNN